MNVEALYKCLVKQLNVKKNICFSCSMGFVEECVYFFMYYMSVF